MSTTLRMKLAFLLALPLWASFAFISHPTFHRCGVSSSTSLHFFGVSAPDVASPSDIKKAMNNPDVTVLDVRSEGEVVHDGFIRTDKRWVHAAATPMGSPMLKACATNLIKDKKAPVVVYCKSGTRAQKAKEILEAQGYSSVFNAGGLNDFMLALK